MTDKERELKGCPFCGGRGHKRTIEIDKDPFKKDSEKIKKRCIECRNKKCRIKPSTWLFVSSEKWEDVISAWNARSPQPVSGDFEEYLQDIHAKDYTGSGDDMGEAFDEWLQALQVDDWFKYVKEYQAHFTGVGGKK